MAASAATSSRQNRSALPALTYARVVVAAGSPGSGLAFDAHAIFAHASRLVRPTTTSGSDSSGADSFGRAGRSMRVTRNAGPGTSPSPSPAKISLKNIADLSALVQRVLYPTG